jgi:hypothetical protein
MHRSMLAMFLAALCGGCVATAQRPTVALTVQARIDPDWSPPAEQLTFTTVLVRRGTVDELLEKELLHYLRGRLIKTGLVYDDNAPQLLVGIAAFIGPFEEYVEPTTFYWPVTSTSRATTTTSTGASATSVTQGPTTYVPIHRRGYTRTRYFRSITIFVGRPRDDGSGVAPVWQTTVESSGGASDLLEVAPTMIRHALTEFPRKSGRPTQRTVPLIRHDDP